nr:hypothetical protein [Tanacetum cinerariifolium]
VVAASTPIPAAKPKILNITVASAVSTRRRKGVLQGACLCWGEVEKMMGSRVRVVEWNGKWMRWCCEVFLPLLTATALDFSRLRHASCFNQVGDLSSHTTRFISPALTQKVFANMRRVRKGFSGVETPLFEGMLVVLQTAKEEVAEGRMIAAMDINEGIELVKDAEVAESEGRNAAEHAEKQAEIYNLDLDHSLKVLSMQEDDSEVQEVVEVVTTAKLITEVVTAAASQVSAASTTTPAASITIPAAKPTIPAAALTIVAAYTRRRKGVIIRDPEEELPLKTPAETPKVKDKGKGILVETPKPMKKKDLIEMDAKYARKLQEEIDRDHDGFNKDIDWDAAMDHLREEMEAEDLDTLWRIVKDRFSTSKLTNFSDEYLLLTLRTMFEEPDGQDAIWRNQKSVHGLELVKRWKLLTLCRVHVITLSTV